MLILRGAEYTRSDVKWSPCKVKINICYAKANQNLDFTTNFNFKQIYTY